MSAGRSEVSQLLQELRKACRRPLFTEISLDNINSNEPKEAADTGCDSAKQIPDASVSLSTRDAMSETDSLSSFFAKRPRIEASKKTWKELLRDTTDLLPFMTEKEHGEVSHFASILLLGFLLPHSTGNEYFLLQHMPDNYSTSDNYRNKINISNTNENDPKMDYILYMDLEDRLEATCRHYAAFEFGEFDTLTDASWELAFDSFLREGLMPFLGGRPAHLDQVDLLHMLAMTIHPQPSETSIPDTATYLEDKPFWLRARKLMSNRHAHSFHVNYEHRRKIVKLLVQNLVLPAYNPESPMVNCALYDGALSHLRVSLHAFVMGAVTMEDAYWARSALLTIAVQSRINVVLKEEWEFLINRMVDDRTQYPGCKCCSQILRQQRFGCFQKRIVDPKGDDSSFCPHAARGLHLTEFLMRTCHSRHSDEAIDFLHDAFSSLADAIEWQMHCWKQTEDAEEKTESEEPPCMLASLLFTAKSFLYFISPSLNGHDKNDRDQESEDPEDEIVTRCEELVSGAIQLVHHADQTIVNEATELLAVAFAYGSKESTEVYAKSIFRSLQMALPAIVFKTSEPTAIRGHTRWSSIQSVVSAASRLSPIFAVSLLNFLLKQLEKAKAKKNNDENDSVDKTGKLNDRRQQERFLLCLVSSIAISNPVIAAEKTTELLRLLDECTEEISKREMLAALLACRQARFFEQKDNPGEVAILDAISQMEDKWCLYQMARHALRTGNFAAACQCYNKILALPLKEQYFLWISTLNKVANSELCLSRYAAKGIPSATTMLRSGLSVLQSLNAFDQSEGYDFMFQITVVRLRLDFLDLFTCLRQLIREMRLTGAGPSKRTRSFLHFQNTIKCFGALARRYWVVYRKYGLFICQQSRTTLRAQHALCRFVARSVRVVFSDVHTTHKKEGAWPGTGPSGDITLPISRFMQRLDEQLLQKMSPSLDPVIRAAAMLELIDGVLLCPTPFPIGFLAVSAIPRCTLFLSADPEEKGNFGADGDVDDLGTIESYPGISFTLCGTGMITASFIAIARLPFHEILLWHKAGYIEPLHEDEHMADEKQEDEHMADEKQEDDVLTPATLTVIPAPWNYTQATTSMLQNGKFNFKIECPPIREEGIYLIEIKLGCRDIRGGEWEIPVDDKSRQIRVQISRSGLHS